MLHYWCNLHFILYLLISSLFINSKVFMLIKTDCNPPLIKFNFGSFDCYVRYFFCVFCYFGNIGFSNLIPNLPYDGAYFINILFLCASEFLLFHTSAFQIMPFFQAGKILCTYKSRLDRVVRFCIWGIVLVSLTTLSW